MLKALELYGFKSFADRTRFEFPEGITVIVGPNGSGKSNVVDAMKWVLGEQSAKSLRGKEMADVIFKGGASAARKPMNTAEATMIFDNSQGQLPLDGAEVHVTRRVYRSGEGEYLVNGQACRLKDIKDLFRGTGVGGDAYSLIEQGKVDTLLVASAKERRAIFEEAAGISRFKAKKVEAQRRLARVEQNLLRLSDIVDEVDGRLRTIRSQAAKARRYQEYNDRLQELRTQSAQVDYRRLSETLAIHDGELKRLADAESQATHDLTSLEEHIARLDGAVDEAAQRIRDCEGEMASNRERIAGVESAAAFAASSQQEAEEELAARRRQVRQLKTRGADTTAQLAESERSIAGIREALARRQAELGELTQRVTTLAAKQTEVRAADAERRSAYADRIRSRNTLSNELSVLATQAAAAENDRRRATTQLNNLQASLGRLEDQLASLAESQQKLIAERAESEEALAACESAVESALAQLKQSQRRRSELEARRQSLAERERLLAELEARLEGINPGVRQALERKRREPYGPWGEIRGMVADTIEAEIESAPLLDAALGERTQWLVVSGRRLLTRLMNGALELEGRVGFVAMDGECVEGGADESPSPSGRGARGEGEAVRDSDESTEENSFRRRPGIIARADDLVVCAPELRPLMRRLLSNVWIVESLAIARELRRTAPGLRFVTLDANVVEPDGGVVVGRMSRSIGLVSRRSELAQSQRRREELQAEIDACEADIVEHEKAHAAARQERNAARESVARLANRHSELTAQTNAATAQQGQLAEQRVALQAQLASAEQEHETLSRRTAGARQSLTSLDEELGELEAAGDDATRRLAELEKDREQADRDRSDHQIAVAKIEERLASAEAARRQLKQNQQERAAALADAESLLAKTAAKVRRCQRDRLAATAALAELYLAKDALTVQGRRLIARRKELAAERAAGGRQVQKLRQELHTLEEQRHRADLAASQARTELTALADRIRDDYGVEISQLAEQATEDERQRAEVEEEIASLRRKLTNIGAVNLEALEEIEGLEERYAALAGQFEDLTKAKESLERIIHRINGDSKRIFLETLAVIRENFQNLFRKVFGGGKADIVLDDEDDVLESGVEIIATPPGKHSLNIALLSGGEKALTAVSLLLAIFQFRPSPFCVLDEVDGPLDEANIDRFVSVLREFLAWSKFIIVTHSKKTMTAANTLYGVTMQESGVSKRVSVQFEDVSDDGHISQAAVHRESEAA